MLPGLRFLFAATLMTISLLVFGMGAIALLRASHQQFASLPPLQPPEPVFAQAPGTVPALSMLRTDPVPAPMPLAEVVAIAPAREASLSRDDRAMETAVSPEPAPAETAADARSPIPEPAVPETAPAAQPPQATVMPETAAPASTGSLAMPEDHAAIEATTAEAPAAETPAAQAEPAEPPLPQARPAVAAMTPVAEPAPAKAVRKPMAKHRVRPAKRVRAKTEKLPAVTSAPTLGWLLGANAGN